MNKNESKERKNKKITALKARLKCLNNKKMITQLFIKVKFNLKLGMLTKMKIIYDFIYREYYIKGLS